ncbi:MAG: type II toxin-antitoxin system RelE/ParE family toxin [Bacteroidota bacterium]
MKYYIQVDARATSDVEKAAEYYENQQKGLGDRFIDAVEKHLDYLLKTAHYQVRYKNVRALLVQPFPFMIHFTIDEKNHLIKVHAIIHTSLDPNKNWL